MVKPSHTKDPVLVAISALDQKVDRNQAATNEQFKKLDQKVDRNQAATNEQFKKLDHKVDRNHAEAKDLITDVQHATEKIKEHLGMQDAYMRQAFDRITDTLDHEDRIRQNERDIADLKRLVATR